MAQTYSNWTAYCVNDGSRDSTAEILNSYAANDERIKVFHTSNAGAASARNYALSKIQNEEWISFVDADDYVGPTMYESILRAIHDSDVDYVRLFSQRTAERYHHETLKYSRQEDIEKRVVSSESYFLNEDVGGYTSNLFVKTALVKNNNLSFCKDMVMLEDQAFSITCASVAKEILVIKEPRNYYYYSGNEYSITRNSKDTSNDIIRCVNIVYNALHSMGSEAVVNDYFYRKYLPIKLDALYGNRLHYRHNKISEVILPEVKININLCMRTKLKRLIVRLLKLM